MESRKPKMATLVKEWWNPRIKNEMPSTTVPESQASAQYRMKNNKPPYTGRYVRWYERTLGNT
ncbi:hypothetical protein [Fervidobacterium sp.]